MYQYENFNLSKYGKLSKKSNTFLDFKKEFYNKLNTDMWVGGFPLYNPELNYLVIFCTSSQKLYNVEIYKIKPHELERKIRDHYLYQEKILEIYNVPQKKFSIEEFDEKILCQLEHPSWFNAYEWYQKNCCISFNNQPKIYLTNKDIQNKTEEDLKSLLNQPFYIVRFDTPDTLGKFYTKEELMEIIKTKTPISIASCMEEDLYFYHYKHLNYSFVKIPPKYYNVCDMDWNLKTVQEKLDQMAQDFQQSNQNYPTIQLKYILMNLLLNKDSKEGERLPIFYKQLNIPIQFQDIIDNIFFNSQQILPEIFNWEEQTKKIEDYYMEIE